MELKMKITEKIIDASTGEESVIEREETGEERQTRLDSDKKIAAKKAEDEKAAKAKSELLAKLGITEEEAKLLLS